MTQWKQVLGRGGPRWANPLLGCKRGQAVPRPPSCPGPFQVWEGEFWADMAWGLSGKCQGQVWSPEMRVLGSRVGAAWREGGGRGGRQVALACWELGAAQVTEPRSAHRAASTLPGPTSAPAEATSTLAGAVPPEAASTALSKASPAPAPTGVLAVAVPPGPMVAVTTTASPAVSTVAVLGTVTKDR